MRILVSLILFIFLSSPAWATTYYVRDGGGTVYGTSNGVNTCNGTTNAVYSLGVSPNCAMSHPCFITGCGYQGAGSTPVWSGGDTLFIDGDSDTSPGNQAQYMVGYGMPNTSGCSTSYAYDCIITEPPAGSDPTHHTNIIGTGTHMPQLWGTEKVYEVLDIENSHVTLQNLEITDHLACAYNDPTGGCPNSYDYGAWGQVGIYMAGDDFTFSNVYIHGLAIYGIQTGQMGSFTFTNVDVIGNGWGGIDVGAGGNTSVTGTLTFNQPIVDWNGCVEAYPITDLEKPSNYSNCWGQTSGGYGDGVAFGATTGEPAGNWTFIGPGSVSWNTQDGIDILHGIAGSGTDQVDKMRLEGNAGQQIKLTGLTQNVSNSLIIGDCGWWLGASQSLSGGMLDGDSCRANGTTFAFAIEKNFTLNFFNNTMITNGIAFESNDSSNNGCDSTTHLNINNNIIQGGYTWVDDTSINPAGGNSQTTNYYADGTDGNGGGTCGAITPTEDYNVAYGNKNGNYVCTGAHDKCGTVPGFTAGIFPSGTPGGAANTFYQGQSGITLLPISSGSAAKNAGENGLSYWNNENDYYNVTRSSPPSMGGLEYQSCAVNSYQCFFNSDCCSSICTNNVCVGSGGGGSTGTGIRCSIGGNSIMRGTF